MTTFVNNKKATFNFELLETLEAGISLLGTEAKSIRHNRGKLDGAFIIIRGGEAFLVGASVPPWQVANADKEYDAERPRKLLLSKKELARLYQQSEQQGLTIVPIKLYNKRGKIKLQIAVARGKKKQDKRESLKERDTKRDIERTLKNQ